MKDSSATPRGPSTGLCGHCRAPLGLGEPRCAACGSDALDPAVRQRAEQMAGELAERWAAAPYFRSADGVSYTPRRQLRGFLADSRHPLGQAMLRHLFELALLVEPSQFRRLVHHAQSALPADAGRLAQALRHLSRVHSDALSKVPELAGAPQLRERVLEATEADDAPQLDRAFSEWHEKWINAAG